MVFTGWAMIYSAGFNAEHASIFNIGQEYGKQFMFIGICAVLSVLVLNVEGNFYIQSAWGIYAVTLFMLILVLVIGTEINGAKAWIKMGNFSLQPSEFSKMGTSLALARFIALSKVEFRRFETRLKALAIVGAPAALIVLQPDPGTLLVFVAFILAMYREGLSGNILIFGLGSVVLGVISVLLAFSTFDYPFLGENSGIYILYVIIALIVILLFAFIRVFVLPRYRKRTIVQALVWSVLAIGFVASVDFVMQSDKVLKPHHKDRIQIMLGLIEDPQGKGYNMDKSKMAIGSGGFSGKGYLEGPLTKYNYVPEQSTDFIFTVIGEEWGFLGCVTVLLLFFGLILRIIFIAERQRSRFTRIYAYCVASILFMHLTINVGMVMGLAPVIGIPLPFFSYGGSSLMGFTLLIFILLRLDAERMSVFR
ncbi:MAG: rod shape-determining protein RodA [Flavobacteriales bacterium]|nr:rod shape-determining protein RodA [Flavobacteriales bacterium]